MLTHLADMIRAYTPEIVAFWYEDARRAPCARGLTRAELCRSLPDHLLALARAADARLPQGPFPREVVEAQLRDRLRQGYELPDVVREYALLERCLYQAWARHVSSTEWPPPPAVAAVHAALGEALRVSVAGFTDYLIAEEQVEKRHVRMLSRIAAQSDVASYSERVGALLEEVRVAMGARCAAAFLCQEDDGVLEPAGCAGVDGAKSCLAEALRSHFLARVLASPHAIGLDGAERERLAGEHGTQAALGTRLESGDRVIGALMVGLESAPPARLERRLEALGDRLGLQLENLRLYAAAQEDLASLREERALRDLFVSTLAHDLRSPLCSAQVNAELLHARATDPALTRLAHKVIRSLRCSDELIQQLLDVNRVRAGLKLPIEVGEMDLTELVQQVAEEQGEARVLIEAPSLLRGVWCARELRRALWNLVGNALKYGADDRPVTVRVQPSDGDVALEVHNFGKPLSPEELPAIFEPFQRAETGVRRAAGWGLGLALVKACAEAHGGRVEVKSSEAAGTTFTLHLPRRVAAMGQTASGSN